MKILSTKILKPTQKLRFIDKKIDIMHFDVLEASLIEDKFIVNTTNLIVTSKKAIPFLRKLDVNAYKIYAIGPVTSRMIQDLGYEVIESEPTGRKLAECIINEHAMEKFTYLCSVDRRNELPDLLMKSKIFVQEIKVYKTNAVEKTFDCTFDAVLFFSPKGVHAFAKANEGKFKRAVCIGPTTAAAARIYIKDVVVADQPSIENTIKAALNAAN